MGKGQREWPEGNTAHSRTGLVNMRHHFPSPPSLSTGWGGNMGTAGLPQALKKSQEARSSASLHGLFPVPSYLQESFQKAKHKLKHLLLGQSVLVNTPGLRTKKKLQVENLT